MTRVYIVNAKAEERSALRLLLPDLTMEVLGEAADWTTTSANLPATRLDMLRQACPAAPVIVLISHLDARQQAALLSGADAFIGRIETLERVAERLQSVAASIGRRQGQLAEFGKKLCLRLTRPSDEWQ